MGAASKDLPMMGHKDGKMAEIHTQVRIRLRKATADKSGWNDPTRFCEGGVGCGAQVLI